MKYGIVFDFPSPSFWRAPETDFPSSFCINQKAILLIGIKFKKWYNVLHKEGEKSDCSSSVRIRMA